MWGDRTYPDGTATTGYIRLKNADETATQVYATYQTHGKPLGLDAAVNWTDAAGTHDQATTFKPGSGAQTWTLTTGTGTVTNWVRFKPSVK